MRLLSIPHSKYPLLLTNLKMKRSKLFVKIITILELNKGRDIDKVRNYIENHMIEDDLEYMNIEELILLRDNGVVGYEKIFELFPEEFDFLDGVPVLMVDDL